MVELILISVFLGFIAFFVFLKVIGGIVKAFLLGSFLVSVIFVVSGFFVYSDLSGFVGDDKLVLLDFSDSRFDSGFVVRGSSFSGDVDSSLSSENVSSFLSLWGGDKDGLLDSFDRVVYVNASGSDFEENLSSLLSSVESFNPGVDSVDDLDVDVLSSIGVDPDDVDVGSLDFSVAGSVDSFEDLSSFLNVPVNLDFDSEFLVSFFAEGRIDFYPDSIGFRVLDFVPSFVFDWASSFIFSE